VNFAATTLCVASRVFIVVVVVVYRLSPEACGYTLVHMLVCVFALICIRISVVVIK
jgi:hypothetical protein